MTLGRVRKREGGVVNGGREDSKASIRDEHERRMHFELSKYEVVQSWGAVV